MPQCVVFIEEAKKSTLWFNYVDSGIANKTVLLEKDSLVTVEYEDRLKDT